MKKYIQIYKLTSQNIFANAGKTFIWMLVGAVESLAMILIWTAAARGQDNIGSMTVSDVVTYYLYIFIIWYIIGGTFFHIISRGIYDGELSNQLVKPIFPYAEYIIREQSWKIFGLLSSIPLLGAFTYLFSDFINFQFNLPSILLSIPAIILGMLIFGIIQFIIGNITHWYQKVGGVYGIYATLEQIFGGSIVPLALMSGIFRTISIILPFRYTFSLPIEIYLSQLTRSEILIGYSIQLMWLFGLFLIAKFIYKKGLKRYESFGN